MRAYIFLVLFFGFFFYGIINWLLYKGNDLVCSAEYGPEGVLKMAIFLESRTFDLQHGQLFWNNPSFYLIQKHNM